MDTPIAINDVTLQHYDKAIDTLYKYMYRLLLIVSAMTLISFVQLLAQDATDTVIGEHSVETEVSVSECISAWDLEFPKRMHYQNLRRQATDSVKQCYMNKKNLSNAERASFLRQIAHMYAGQDADSAVHYYELAAVAASDNKEMKNVILAESCLDLAICDVLGLAIDRFESIDTQLFDTSELRNDYHVAAFRLFNHIALNARDTDKRHEAMRRRDIARDWLLHDLPENSPLYKFFESYKLEAEGKTHLALAACHAAIVLLDRRDQYYAPSVSALARYYKELGKTREWVRYSVEAALSQLLRGDRYNGYILSLSRMFNELDDHERASQCVAAALDDSLDAGAVVSAMKAADDYRDVGEAYYLRIRSQHRHLLILAIILASVCTIICSVWMLTLFRQRRHKHEKTVQQLPEINSTIRPCVPQPSDKPVSDCLINFLNLCDKGLERLESFQKLAKRKITAGQSEDLLRLLNSGKPINESAQEIFSTFDNEFLKLYPDFISDINRLLKPDKQIDTTDGSGQLTNELRIFALQWLGIEESKSVARLLGVSVSTIYTYRNKMRLRAVDRDTFDDDIRNLGKK